jgi:ubiquinone/menaquinone biosynthesis C-methylase UbiE
MTFVVDGDEYDRYMGRYSRLLAPRFVDFAGVEPGIRALDVGCGPGALTAELARRLGADAVFAVDPSESLAAACAERVPGAHVLVARAESLPWPDECVDAALAQLVVNFLRDAPAGVKEMRRVVRPGGTLAACTWDYSHGMRMLRIFWDAALDIDPHAPDEGRTMSYQDPEELAGLWRDSGVEEVETASLEVEAGYADFDDFWAPFLSGVGPGGAYCVSLPPRHQAALRDGCRERLGRPGRPFVLSARAWAVRGRVA